MEWKARVTGPAGKKALEGLNIAVYTAVVVAIVVVANVFLNRYFNHRFDLTPEKRFSLSPQTVKILKELTEDVAIYDFDRSDSFRRARDLLDNYKAQSRRVSVHYIDPNSQPQLARQFGVRTFGTVVVAAGDRHFEASGGATEEGVTNALVRVLKSQKTAYFVQGHGEHDPENSDRFGFSGIKKQLENENFLVKTVNLLEKPDVPADCAVLAIGGPQKDYQPQEVDAIRKYVNGGGRLLVMFDSMADPRAQKPENLEKLLAEWNVTVHDDLVIEPTVRILNAGAGMTVVRKYGSSPIVQPLAGVMALFPLTRSFAIGKEYKAGVTDESLCDTSEESYGVADYGPKTRDVVMRPGKDFKGPLSVAVSGEVSGGAPGASAPAGDKKGRFVALGTSALAANAYLDFEGNRDLFMNIVNWLASEEDLISIRPKPPESQHLTMTAQQMNRVFWLGVVGLPLLIIVTGASVWWLRR